MWKWNARSDPDQCITEMSTDDQPSKSDGHFHICTSIHFHILLISPFIHFNISYIPASAFNFSVRSANCKASMMAPRSPLSTSGRLCAVNSMR
jgi:hypothetical protein